MKAADSLVTAAQTAQTLRMGRLAGDARTRPARQRILDSIRAAAIREFSDNGFKGTSTQAIADRAGLTKAQLHYYIRGKDELYEELLAQVLQDWKLVFPIASDGAAPAELMAGYIRNKMVHALAQPDISRIFTREVLDGAARLAPYWPRAREWTERNVATLQAWMAQGLMPVQDARLTLMHIWAVTQHYADFALQVKVMLGQAPEAVLEQERLIEEVTAFLLRGCGLVR